MKTLSVEINEVQLSELEQAISQVPGWNKALIVRALLAHFLQLEPEEREHFVKKYRVIQPTQQ